MALINTLRQKMGKIVVALVAFSMVAFIGTDLLQGNSAIFGSQNEVGEINGNVVKYEDFNAKVEELSYNYSLNTGRNPTSTELEQIRQQAWQELVLEYVFVPQFEELGVTVTSAEIVDMVQGNNIHPQIRQYFTDPETGQFDKQNVIAFLRNLQNANPQQRQSWIAFESNLAPSRQLIKYENLLEKTKFANKYEAKAEYRKTAKATVDYIYVPYSSVPDSTFEISESELTSYLNENSEEYQREESKDISYVAFDIVPSREDTAFVKTEINKLREGLINAQNDSTYVSINSDKNNGFQTLTNKGELPSSLIDAEGEIVEEGTVSEPYLRGDFFVVDKLSRAGEGDEAFVRASHILFKAEDDSEEGKLAAKESAKDVLADLKGGADFAAMAATYGTDGTAARGGDLGWFGETSNFVEEFKEAAFSFSGTGLLPDVVETEFGYHIIKITEPKTNVIYKVATIEKEIFPSDLTTNAAYREADLFASDSESVEDFVQNAAERGVQVKKAANISKNAKRVGNMAEARSIVYWLYNEAETGSVSEVFEMDNQYVVAVQTAYQEKGTAELADVRNEITRKVLNKKKADFIIEKMNSLSGSYEEMATAYGTGARTNNTEIVLSSNSFGDVGLAPEAVGTAFSLNAGESTRPFATPNGVVAMTLVSKDEPADTESYEAFRPVVLNNQRSFRRSTVPATYQNIYDALVDRAEIEDNRYKFY